MAPANFITLNAFQRNISAWDAKLYDDFALTNNMDFDLPCNLTYTNPTGGRGRGSLTSIAFGQLCGRMGIPASWAGNDKLCPAPLRKYVINWKFKHTQARKLMVRQRKQGRKKIVRALLSTRYRPYDHLQFVDALIAALNQLGAKVDVFRPEIGDVLRAFLIVKNFKFRPENRWEQISSGILQDENGSNERRGLLPIWDGGEPGGLKPAIYISNSEVGTGAVRVTAGLFRSYCSNGLILGWQAKYTLAIPHLHVKANMIVGKIKKAIPQALNISEEAAIQFLKSQSIRIDPSSLTSLVNRWLTQYDVEVNERKNWLRHLDEEVQKNDGQVSWFDVINSASRWAGQLKNREQCETMERMAGAMISARVPQNALVEAG